ncbi:serine/threonine-protein kinase [Kitasatospora brasiliensis]|uniref:serine/threonine-protein kinase n=1 Tax=Kitasatospora brasiliensis TaxID=3058040 RepID=UPI00292CA80A|nr:serine/threonine-protein kinase [Kitasatospora sp. K002]
MWVLDNRFEISGPSRRGGMGAVHRAVDRDTGKVVAVKFLAPINEDDAGLTRRRPTVSERKRFQRECTMYELLGGQGVPALVTHQLTRPRPYLVTEFIDGADLNQFLQTNRPPVAATAAIAVQLLRVLARVHSCEVVHRDVKPHNVLLGHDGTVHLVDFGIALPVDPLATRHTEGRTPGSIHYQAPEIILGERQPGPTADVYGVGCIVFQLITGRLVFAGSDVDYIIERHHCETPAPPVSEFVDGLPDEVVGIVTRMLSKDPSLRPSPEEIEAVFAPLLPRPGDPAPNPSCRPDPTLPFRAGGAPGPVPARPVRRARPRVQRAALDGPSRSTLRELNGRAAEEVTQGNPGAHVERLALLLPDACRKWTEADHDVLAGRLVCANAARITGDWITAGTGYRKVVRQLEPTPTEAPLQDLLVEARLGAAECLVEDQQDGEALRLWSWAADVLLDKGDSAPPRLLDMCQEVGAYLAEQGQADAVDDLLRRLPRR